MGQIERHGHQAFRFVRSVAEHHALVASPLFFLVLTVNATVDVLALFVNGAQNATRIAIKLILSLRVTDALDGLSSNSLQVYVHVAAHFTHQHHLSCSNERLASHTSS